MQIGVSVSKKRVKKAVSRNLIKRRIREAYRLNKHLLNDQLKDNEDSFAVMILYIGKGDESFQFIEQKLEQALEILGSTLLS